MPTISIEDPNSDPESVPALVMDVKKAAKVCGVSTKTIYRAVADGRLKAARLGQGDALRIRVEWIDEWIDDAVVTASPSSNAEMPGLERTEHSVGRLAA